MKLSTEQQRLKDLLTDTICLLCKNGLAFKNKFSIEALIGITLDEDDVILVNINEIIQSSIEAADKQEEEETTEVSEKRKKRKRKRRPSKQSSGTEQNTITDDENDDASQTRDDADDNRSSVNIKEEPDIDEEPVIIKEEPAFSNNFSQFQQPPVFPGDFSNSFTQPQFGNMIPLTGSAPGVQSTDNPNWPQHSQSDPNMSTQPSLGQLTSPAGGTQVRLFSAHTNCCQILSIQSVAFCFIEILETLQY